MKTNPLVALLVLALSTLNFQLSTFAQGTAFTYQGRLNDGANPASGSYDVTFTLFAVDTGGSALAGPLTNSPTGVSNGLFTVTLDFGNQFPGADRWLEIGVRTNGGGAFDTLGPRQKITATPYAIQSANATTAAAANNFSGSLSGDVTGTQTATVVATVGGQTAANVASGASAANAAASANAASTIVKRDATGSFSAGGIAATNFTGNGAGLTNLNPANLVAGTAGINISGNAATATTATTAGNFSGSLAGDVTGTQGATAVANVGGQTAANVASGASAANAATSANTANTLVKRDASGNFAAGTITGTSFSGSGAGLTSLNASLLTSGVVPDARLSGTYSGVVNFLNVWNSFDGSFYGIFDGSGGLLYGLNASELDYGTVPGARLSGTYSNALTFNNATNSFSGSGSGLTSLNASQLTSGTVSDSRLSANVALLNGTNVFTATNRFAGVLVATNAGNQITGTFSGNGSALTSLNASLLTIGTVPNARLSGTYSNALILNNAANGFSGYFGGFFSGDGSLLGNLNASQLTSGTVADARLSGTYSSALTFNNAANSFSGSGSGLTSLNASQLTSGTVADGRLSANVALLNASQTFTGINTFNNAVSISATNMLEFGAGVAGKESNAGKIGYQAFTVDALDIVGAGTTGSNRKIKFWAESGSVFAGNVTATGFVGPGGNLTALNASQLTSGTVPDARLSANVALLAAANTFSNIQKIVGNGSMFRLQPPAANSSSYMEFNDSTGGTLFRGLLGSDGPGFTGTTNQFVIATWTASPIRFFTSASERMVIAANGNVGIGTTIPDALLSVNGSATKAGGGSWGTYSDARLKDVGEDFTHGLKDLAGIQPVHYHYKADNPLNLSSTSEYIGVVAQQVEQVIPEAVQQNAAGYRTVNNDPIIWTMVNAIKELNAKVERKDLENAELKSRLEKLERLMSEKNRGAK